MKFCSALAFSRAVLKPILYVLYTQPLFEMIINKLKKTLGWTFADSIQPYREITPDQIQETTEIMQYCITDVRSRVAHNKLQFNNSKTEPVLVKSHSLSIQSNLSSFIHIQKSDAQAFKTQIFQPSSWSSVPLTNSPLHEYLYHINCVHVCACVQANTCTHFSELCTFVCMQADLFPWTND